MGPSSFQAVDRAGDLVNIDGEQTLPIPINYLIRLLAPVDGIEISPELV